MERLDKIIAGTGKYSRREVKELVRQGRVVVDGRLASSPEEKVDADAACLLVDGQSLDCRRYTYLMLHKPAGVLSARVDGRQQTVLDLLPPELRKRDLSPVGRLDKDSEGLLLVANDGDLMQRLIHPKFEVSKLYRVTVQGDWRRGIPQLQTMDTLEGESIAPAQVELDREMGESAVLLITIHQGKNRQIRRMCRQAGLTVTRLERIAEHGIYLADLPCGKWRALTAEERMRLKESEKK